jgi:hypothetical protein
MSYMRGIITVVNKVTLLIHVLKIISNLTAFEGRYFGAS